MSLSLWNDPFCFYSRPSRILDQHFAMELDPEDFIAPLISREFRPVRHWRSIYYRPWRSAKAQKDAGSTVDLGKDKFQASLDVQQFKPEEITVKVSENENTVTVEGKHEEKQDEHGYISRHFVRKYVLPKGHDLGKVESRLSSDGILTITAPKNNVEDDQKRIPVIQTGKSSNEGEVEERKAKRRKISQ